eukprot:TRINITY_DN26474_c0_g1_i1.p1 TRINITY_DN26474_c0_g1~~TRINITY_DN26474_c0_g1_i1.p1  ORF type:complete len:164 (-),score=9.44 TRINITY_DN26474_c0_g1_i1:180-671(-)
MADPESIDAADTASFDSETTGSELECDDSSQNPVFIRTGQLSSPTLREWMSQVQRPRGPIERRNAEGNPARSRPGKRRRDRIKNMLANEQISAKLTHKAWNPRSRLALYYNKLQLGLSWKVHTQACDAFVDPHAVRVQRSSAYEMVANSTLGECFLFTTPGPI